MEIVLTGVHVGDYGLDLDGERQLAALIRTLLALPGLERFRLSSIEPSSVTGEIVELTDQGVLDPVVDESFPFDQAADAHSCIQDRKNFGKVLLTP